MLEISQEISRNFTPCFFNRMPIPVEKTRFTARELLDIGEEIRRDFAPKVSFNTPELTLLPVDPGYVHAYWNMIAEQESIKLESQVKQQLTLRFYTQTEDTNRTEALAQVFDVVIDSPNCRQHIPLPVVVGESAYSAVLGKYDEHDHFIVFAHSNIIHTPRGSVAWCQSHNDFNAGPGKNRSGQGISNKA